MEPFPYVSDKDMLVLLCEKVCRIADGGSLTDAFRTTLKCARTLGMDFSALNDGHRRVTRATAAETVYPVLKILLSSHSTRKKIIIVTGYLAELAEEKGVCLC